MEFARLSVLAPACVCARRPRDLHRGRAAVRPAPQLRLAPLARGQQRDLGGPRARTWGGAHARRLWPRHGRVGRVAAPGGRGRDSRRPLERSDPSATHGERISQGYDLWYAASPAAKQGFSQSGERASNPRPQAWEACALPTELSPRDPDSRALCGLLGFQIIADGNAMETLPNSERSRAIEPPAYRSLSNCGQTMLAKADGRRSPPRSLGRLRETGDSGASTAPCKLGDYAPHRKSRKA